MADPETCLPLEPTSVRKAHQRIKQYIHRTPLLTCKTLDRIASSPGQGEPGPRLRLFFKCENFQKIGAFKARGAHHAVLHLIDTVGIEELKRKGVVTHSSGNHAQALALAASTFGIPAYIVMPTISTPSKIAGTKQYTEHVIFSGSTSQEREAKVEEVINETGAILVPPYDHPDIILGQGTVGLEMEEQYLDLVRDGYNITEDDDMKSNGRMKSEADGVDESNYPPGQTPHLDAILIPLGGGGLLGGIATNFSTPSSPELSTTSTTTPSPPSFRNPTPYIFGAEPSFSAANDAQRGLATVPPTRIPHVSSLTIADGLRTPVGLLNWRIIADRSRVEAVYSVSEAEIKETMKLVLERMKVLVEPSGVVALAVVLFCPEWRSWVREMQRREGIERAWDVGVVFSGGNTTVDAVCALFGETGMEGEGEKMEKEQERAEGKIGVDGSQEVEDVAG